MLCDGPAAATFGSSYDRHLKHSAEVPRDVATFHVTSASPLRCVCWAVVGPAEQLLASTSVATTMLTSMALLALATSAVVSADAASLCV